MILLVDIFCPVFWTSYLYLSSVVLFCGRFVDCCCSTGWLVFPQLQNKLVNGLFLKFLCLALTLLKFGLLLTTVCIALFGVYCLQISSVSVFANFLTSFIPSLHIPGEFPGNSRGTGKFSRFSREPLPQNVPVIQREHPVWFSPTNCVLRERSVGVHFLRF